MRCLQIQISYTNDKGQKVGVTIVSDPLPDGITVNKDNSNQLASDVFKHIYNNPDATGHLELIETLRSASNINQVDISESEINNLGQDGISFKKEQVRVTNEGVLRTFASDDELPLLDKLKENNMATAFPIKVYQLIDGEVDPESGKVTAPNDFTKSSYYDKVNRILFISSPTYGLKEELDFKEALINSILPSNQTKGIKEIAETEDDFNPLLLEMGVDKIPNILNVITSLKDTESTLTKVRRVNPNQVESFIGKPNTVVVDYPVDGDENHHFGNPFKAMTNNPSLAAYLYDAWLKGRSLPLSLFSLNSNNDFKTTLDIEGDRQKWVSSELEKLKGKPITFITTEDAEKSDANVLKNFFNDDVEGLRVPSHNDTFEDYAYSIIVDNFIDNESAIPVKIGATIIIGVSEDLSTYVNKLLNPNITRTLTDSEYWLLEAIDKYSGETIRYSDLVNEALGKGTVPIKLAYGDLVSFNGDNYIYWKTNEKGKARLISLDGKNYRGTPNVEGLELVKRGNSFEHEGDNYVVHNGAVYSLHPDRKSGQIEKEKDFRVIQQAALNQGKLFSASRIPTLLMEGNVYSSDQSDDYDRHLKIRASRSDKGKLGTISRLNLTDALVQKQQIERKLGNQSTSNIRTRVDSRGNTVYYFTMDEPTLLSETYQELLDYDDRVKKESDIRELRDKWENLSDSEKAVLDLDRYNEETSILGSRSMSSSFTPKGRRVDSLYDYLFKHSDVLTATSVLKELAKDNPLAEELLKFSNLLKGVNITARNVEEIVHKVKGKDVRANGTYNPNNRQIEVAKYANYSGSNTSEQTLLHEILHAITYDYIRNNPESEEVVALTNIYNEIKDRLVEYQYSTTTLDEFITGVYTDTRFRQRLQNTNVDSRKDSMWDKVLNVFKKMFKFASGSIQHFNNVMNYNYAKTDPNEAYYPIAKRATDNLLNAIYEKESRPKANTFKRNVNSSYRSSNDIVSSIPYNTRVMQNGEVKAPKELKPSTRTNLRNFSRALAEKYNLSIEHYNSKEIQEKYNKNGINYGNHRAFVEDGQIVINEDFATFAEPLHELSHLILDGLKATNTKAYNYIISEVKSHPIYEYVAKLYPELSGDELSEEAFVTIVGEHYNGTVESQMASKWNLTNSNFFTRTTNSFKNFLGGMFGLGNHSFRNLSGHELMNLDLNTLIDRFTTSALKGDFIKEVNLSKQRQILVEDGTYLKSNLNRPSSFYETLRRSNGISEDMASRLWLGIKTENFYNWHKGRLVREVDGEPRLFYRGSEPNILYDRDLYGSEDVVVARGELSRNEDGSYTVPLSNVRSVYEIDHADAIKTNYSIENVAQDNKISLVGTRIEMNSSVKKLKEMFPDYEFSIGMYGDVNHIRYSRKPHPDVAKLRDILLKNHSNTTC